MSLNGASPNHPQPSAVCDTYAPLLPLLRTRELTAEQAQVVESHVAACERCCAKLAQYDVVYAGLRRHFSPGAPESSWPIPKLAEIADLAEEVELPEITPSTASTSPPPRTLRRAAAVFPAVAAVLLIALLAALLGGRRGIVGPAAVPTPTLDAASQAYVSMLRRYYVPMVTATDPAQGCVGDVGYSQPAVRAQLMVTCRAPIETQLAAARTFSAQLAIANPPVRWRAQDAILKHATTNLIDVLTTQIAAIDARNLAQFLETADPGSQSLKLFFNPIDQINRDLHVGPPPLPYPLPIPDTHQYG